MHLNPASDATQERDTATMTDYDNTVGSHIATLIRADNHRLDNELAWCILNMEPDDIPALHIVDVEGLRSVACRWPWPPDPDEHWYALHDGWVGPH